MSSLFTFNESPSAPSSPWASALSTPAPPNSDANTRSGTPNGHDRINGIRTIASEPQEGATEYKLSLLNPTPLRLQHLTTQLLWRLQQSSGSHNTAGLVPPHASVFEKICEDGQIDFNDPKNLADRDYYAVLLQDSQGCLYELGVADDGEVRGISEEDMDITLNTLKIMASALGCEVQILRRHAVGFREVEGIEIPLYAVEANVRPVHSNSQSSEATLVIPQLRITLFGHANAGKSTLAGSITESVADSGRGKARVAMLKHPHEVKTGHTSHVASGLLGFTADGELVNFRTRNVGSWTDIHAVVNSSVIDLEYGQENLARTVFLIDAPGSYKYRKTAVRGLMAWDPHYTAVILASDIDISDGTRSPAFEYLKLCLKLELRFFLLISKLDLANSAGLKKVCKLAFDTIHAAGKEPRVVQNGETGVVPFLEKYGGDILLGKIVPVILMSAVSEKGLDTFQSLTCRLPVPPPHQPFITATEANADEYGNPQVLFHVDEAFGSPSNLVETVLGGYVRYGQIHIGDKLLLGPFVSVNCPTPGSSYTETSRYLGKSPSNGVQDDSGGEEPVDEVGEWIAVKVVSVRKSRQPVGSLVAGEAGTIGICQWSEVPAPDAPDATNTISLAQVAASSLLRKAVLNSHQTPPSPSLLLPQSSVHTRAPLHKSVSFADTIDPPPPSVVGLKGDSRIRKGMVLLSCLAESSMTLLPKISHGFTADFDATEEGEHAPLNVGTHVNVCFGGVRAPARVTKRDMIPANTSDVVENDEEDVFGFDEEPMLIRYSFDFRASVEWIEIGAKVLVTDIGRQGVAASVRETGLDLEGSMVGRIVRA